MVGLKRKNMMATESTEEHGRTRKNTEEHGKNSGEPLTASHLIYLAKTQRSQSTIISLRLANRDAGKGREQERKLWREFY
jgi:hypothetical protein